MRKVGNVTEVSAKARNTREVVAVRFAESERRQVARAAELRDVPFSAYVREASIRSAFDDVAAQRRLATKPKPTIEEREPREPLVVVDDEPVGHYVDGELVHRVDGILVDAELRPLAGQ